MQLCSMFTPCRNSSSKRSSRQERSAACAAFLLCLFSRALTSIVGIPIPTVSTVSAVGLRLGWHIFLRMRVACALACTLVAVSAHDGQRRLTSQKRYSCAEAKDRDEIIFDCGGEFISQATSLACASRDPHPRAPF